MFFAGRKLRQALMVLILTVGGLVALAASPTEANWTRPQKIATRFLPNLIQVHEKVFSGGQPDGVKGFSELKSLGVRTVICVDGKHPDLTIARQMGMRYVHLPLSYDRISRDQRLQLAKSVHHLDGPIYIHCHHGKQRSPAATAVACITTGLIPKAMGMEVLQLAGTNTDYRGLYRSVRESKRIKEAELEEYEFDFPETSAAAPMAQVMVSLAVVHDRLQTQSQTDWRVLSEDKFLDRVEQALLLREHFSELLRIDDVRLKINQFRRLLDDSQAVSKQLEDVFRRQRASVFNASDAREIDRCWNQLTRNCQACHRQFRDQTVINH